MVSSPNTSPSWPSLRNGTFGSARGIGSSNGRWAITFRMQRVSLKLVVEPDLFSKAFARPCRGCGWLGAKFLATVWSLRERVCPGVDLYQMDARHIPFEREFDVIGAFDVLEHVDEDDSVLRQMFRATRPHGGILVTVPQHRFLWSTIDEHSMHQRRYSRAELRRKVEEAGFRIQRMTSFISLLLPFMMCSRMKRTSNRDFKLWREFEISRPLNALLESILTVERGMVEAGISFPSGGSLLLIAKRPMTRR